MIIKTANTSSILLATALSLAAVNTVSADIQEISPEEMTETHIRDTTVIIKKQQPSQKSPTTINVKVMPNEAGELDSMDDPNQNAVRRPDLTPLSDAYMSEQRERSLQQQQSNVNRLPYDPSQIERQHNLNKIWKEFNLQGDIPTDYGNLTFPTTIDPSGGNIPAGTDLSIGKHDFSISIPNTNNYKPSTQQSPNGEYQINITNDNIKFIINLPQNAK